MYICMCCMRLAESTGRTN